MFDAAVDFHGFAILHRRGEVESIDSPRDERGLREGERRGAVSEFVGPLYRVAAEELAALVEVFGANEHRLFMRRKISRRAGSGTVFDGGDPVQSRDVASSWKGCAPPRGGVEGVSTSGSLGTTGCPRSLNHMITT